MRLVFKLELFKPTIGISVFGSKICITRPIAPKICTKKDSYVPHPSSKIQVSTFSRFKVTAFLIFVAEFVNLSRKKHRDFRREARRGSPKKMENKNNSIHVGANEHNQKKSGWLCAQKT